METKALEQRLGKIPIFRTLGFQLEAVSKGRATLIAPYDPSYDGIFQSFHGGLLMTLADTAACVAVLMSAGANAEITTTDMNIRFLAHADRTALRRLQLSSLEKRFAQCR